MHSFESPRSWIKLCWKLKFTLKERPAQVWWAQCSSFSAVAIILFCKNIPPTYTMCNEFTWILLSGKPSVNVDVCCRELAIHLALCKISSRCVKEGKPEWYSNNGYPVSCVKLTRWSESSVERIISQNRYKMPVTSRDACYSQQSLKCILWQYATFIIVPPATQLFNPLPQIPQSPWTCEEH